MTSYLTSPTNQALGQEFFLSCRADGAALTSSQAHNPHISPEKLQSLAGLNQRQTALIVGAGCVGLATALALLKQGLSVVMYDQVCPAPYQADKLDLKVFAVNHHNVAYLETLGGWQEIAALRANPYQVLTQRIGAAGAETVFSADEIQLPQLGYMVENSALVNGLLKACQAYSNFYFLAGTKEAPLNVEQAKLVLSEPVSVANATKVNQVPKHWEIRLSNGLELTTSAVIACDGANSFWRRQAKIPVSIDQYPTKCCLFSVKTNPVHTAAYTHTTWQQVDPAGPKAWLPMAADEGVLCWYDYPEVIDAIVKNGPAALKQRMLKDYPLDKLGDDFEVGAIGAFPLQRVRALTYYQNNVVLLGDAAHTVSPLAGQGLNIGLQDVQTFSQKLSSTFTSLDLAFTAYYRERYGDNTLMQEGLSFLHRSYISKSPLAQAITNNLGKFMQVDALKQASLQYAVGNRDFLKGISLARDAVASFWANATAKKAK